MDASLGAGRPGIGQGIVSLLLTTLIVAAVYVVVGAPLPAVLAAQGIATPPISGEGIALAAALVAGRAAWPGIFLGALIADLLFLSPDLDLTVTHAVATTLGAAVGATLMRMPVRGRAPTLSFREVRQFVVFGVLVNAAIASVGHAILGAVTGAPVIDWAQDMSLTFLSHMASVMVFAPPALLLWIDRRPLSTDRWKGMVAIAGSVLVISAFRVLAPFGEDINPGLPLLVLFACTWLSMLFAQREATVLFAVAELLTILSAALAPATSTQVGAPFLASLAMAFTMLNVLMVSSLSEERRIALMLAGVDALSGVANRRTFFDRALQEAERAKRYGRPLAIATFDLDNFKDVNDTHGHAAGDATIRAAAAAVAAQLRRLDTLARVGGEEFAVLMPETEPLRAEAVCERLRRAVASTVVESGSRRFSVTASFGMTEFDAEHDTVESAMSRADKALYRAKEEGRNRVYAA